MSDRVVYRTIRPGRQCIMLAFDVRLELFEQYHPAKLPLDSGL